MKFIKKLLCIVLVLVSVFTLNACDGNDVEGGKEPETYPPAKVMTIKKIYEDYDANALRAEETHEGQRYKCNVQVERITEEYVYARVWAGYVSLYYEGQREFVMNLSENDVITFEGTLTEIKNTGNMTFEDVVFIEVLYNNKPNGIYHHVIEE